MKISAKTDTGKVRNSNQDSYSVCDLTDGSVMAVVCDGMGGAKGGNIASEAAVRIISEKIRSGFHEGMNENSMRLLLSSAIESANGSIFSMSCDNDELSGMGTTVVCAIIKNDTAFIANAGDSRLYIVDNSKISQITTDHSIVQMMVDNGEITPEEAKDHPKKNVITRALGVENSLRIDYAREELNDGDTVLLCTDGLTNFVDDASILNVCNTCDAYQVADELVALANENGGGDNVTVVSVSV